MKIRTNRKSFLFKLITSYFVLIFISVASIGLSFNSAILRNVDSGMRNLSMDSLRQINYTIDEYIFKSIEQLSLDIYANRQFQFFRTEKSIEPSLTSYDFINYLGELKNSYDYINSIAIIFSDKELVCTENGIWSKKDYSQIYGVYLDETKEYDKKDVEDCWMDVRTIKGITSDQQEYLIAPFIRSSFSTGDKKKDWYIIINVNADEIYKNMLIHKPDRQKLLYIANPDGRLLFGDSESMDLLDGNKDFFGSIVKGKTQGDTIRKIKGVDYLVSFTTSMNSGWKYILIMEDDSFKGMIGLTKKLLVLICALTLLFGFTISSVYANKLNAPLKKILNLVRGLNLNKTVNTDEYGILNDTIKEMSDKISLYRNNLYENLPAIKLVTISNIIRAKVKDNIDIDQKLKLFNIQFGLPGFLVIVVELDHYSQLSENLGMERMEILKIKLVQALEEGIHENMACIAAEYEINRFACVVNLDGDYNNNANILYNVISGLAEDFKLTWHVTFSVGIGTIQDSLGGLAVSFNNAHNALEYKFITGNESFIEYNSVSYKYINEIGFPRKIYDNFINAVGCCNLQDALAALENFRNFCLKSDLKIRNIKSITREFAVSFFNYVDESNIGSTIATDKDYQVFDRLADMETLSEYIDWLGRIGGRVISQLELKKTDKYKDLAGKIIEYIHANIDKDINFNSLAENVHFSPNYLSKVFKDEIGITFTDYVINTKLEYAKRLLKEHDMMIQDVSAKIGYANPQYFIKKFKMRYGITPKQYQIECSMSNLSK